MLSGLVSGLSPSLRRLNRESHTRKVAWLKSSISSETYLWLVVTNVFLIPRTDVIVVLLAECGLVLCAASLCFVTLHHEKKAGTNKLLCKLLKMGCNHIKATCGIPIIHHK